MHSTYWTGDSLCLPWKFMNFKWKKSLLWIPTFVEFYNKILKFTQKKSYLNLSNLHQGEFAVFLKILFSGLLLAALGLCCCERALSSCGEWGPLCGSAQLSRCAGFSFLGAQALGVRAAVAAPCPLSSWGCWALGHSAQYCGAWA